MTGESPRPIFGFLWNRDGRPAGQARRGGQAAPVGLDRQDRWLRVTPRGPWRLALLITVTMGLITFTPPALVALVAAPSVWPDGAAKPPLSGYAALVVTIVLVPAVALLARGWVAGCYVNDAGIKIATVLRTTYIPWSEVTQVRSVVGPTRWLGTPLRVAGTRIECVSGTRAYDTGLCSHSPDVWLRPQAWDATGDRVQTWWREARDP